MPWLLVSVILGDSIVGNSTGLETATDFLLDERRYTLELFLPHLVRNPSPYRLRYPLPAPLCRPLGCGKLPPQSGCQHPTEANHSPFSTTGSPVISCQYWA